MKPAMLAEFTDLMSRVGRANPELVQDRNVALFIQACIEEAKKPAGKKDPGVGDTTGVSSEAKYCFIDGQERIPSAPDRHQSRGVSSSQRTKPRR